MNTSYNGAPTASGTVPAQVRESLTMDIDRAQLKDLLGARAAVNDAIQKDSLPESDLITALDFMERSSNAVDAKRQEHATIQQKAVRQSYSAPTIVNSIGDSYGSMARSFSLTDAIQRAAEGRQLEGAEAEAFAEAKKEYPAARGSVLIPAAMRSELRNVYGNNSGQSGIDANVGGRQTLSTGDTLLARHFVPMAEQLGARRIDASGAGTLLVPYLGRTDATTANEGAAATSSSSFSELSLTPQRYTRKTSVSALALATTGSQLDRILLSDFDRAHAAAFDKVVFAAIRDNATFTTSTASGADMAATGIADLFNLQQDAMNATGVSGYFDLLASPIGMNVLNTSIVANSDQTLGQMFVSQTGRRVIPIVSMLDATFTEADVLGSGAGDVAGAGHLVSGDMTAAVAAIWGGVSLMVDPYSMRDEHVLNVHADSYVAAGIVSDAFRVLAVSDTAITPA